MEAADLVGTWRLVSFESIRGDELEHPLGSDAVGYLDYTPRGRMSVAIMRSGRTRFGSPDLRAGRDAERAAAAEGYTSYCGTYEVRGDQVIHHIEVSLFPNWIGTAQARNARLEGERLVLSSDIAGTAGARRATLVWERVP